MKCIIVVLFFVSLTYGGDVMHNQLEEDLLTFFDMWLKGDVQNFMLSLPALDVITVPELEGTFKEFGIKLSYSTSEMKLTGLPNAFFDELVAAETNTSLTVRGSLVAPSLVLNPNIF